jgi:hypothetical protein
VRSCRILDTEPTSRLDFSSVVFPEPCAPVILLYVRLGRLGLGHLTDRSQPARRLFSVIPSRCNRPGRLVFRPRASTSEPLEAGCGIRNPKSEGLQQWCDVLSDFSTGLLIGIHRPMVCGGVDWLVTLLGGHDAGDAAAPSTSPFLALPASRPGRALAVHHTALATATRSVEVLANTSTMPVSRRPFPDG